MKFSPSLTRILIADDQPDVLEALRLLLKREGLKTDSAESPQQALHLIESHEYDLAITKDKDYAVVEGANHGFTPCIPCQTTPNQYSNTMKNLFDYAAAWINKRY